MTILAHSADWHIDSSKFLPDNLDRQSKAVDEVFRIADEERVNYLLVCGDMLDSHLVSEEARILLMNKIIEGDKHDFISIYINGNHEIYKNKGSVLKLFEEVSTLLLKRTIIVDMEPRLLNMDDISIMAIPFKKGLNNKRFIKTARQGYKERKCKYYVIMSHFAAAGGIRDNGTVFEDGIEIPKDIFWDYLALGDLHQQQKVGKRSFYCGSPVQHRFDQSLPKGIMIANIEDHNFKFVPIESKNIKTLSVLKDIPKKWPENEYVKLKISSPPENIPDCVVKIESTVEGEVIEDIDLDDITQGLPEYCANRGINKKGQRWCLKKVESIRRQINEY